MVALILSIIEASLFTHTMTERNDGDFTIATEIVLGAAGRSSLKPAKPCLSCRHRESLRGGALLLEYLRGLDDVDPGYIQRITLVDLILFRNLRWRRSGILVGYGRDGIGH